MAADATKRAVLGGGSGFIGRRLKEALQAEGYEVLVIGRTGPDARWNDPASILRAVDGAELVVGLAGKSVNCRYDDANRTEILRSRVETTKALRQAIAAAEHPPAVWMNASTATIYRYAMDQPQVETSGELDTGFSPDVGRTWEAELFAGELPRTRRVALRSTIVLGDDGAATSLLFRLARLGVGGPQFDGWWFRHKRYRGIGPDPTEHSTEIHRSKGYQKFSWIHIDDLVSAVRFIRDHAEISGPVNIAAPNPSDNRSLMAALRRTVGMPIGLPAWRFMLEPAMWVLRTESELILKSRWVLPGVLTQAGFVFEHPELEPALRDIRNEGRSAA